MKKFTLLLLILNINFAFSQNAPIDFEPDGFGASWTWATFEAPMGEENPVFSVVPNPSADEVNGSANVAKMEISYATDASWGSAGCESMHGSDIGTFAVTEQNKIVKMAIYQEGFAAPVALKFAVDHGGALLEVIANNSVADRWVEVEFNMSEWIGHPLGSPDQIIFFPSYGLRASGHTVYFDNVTFSATGSGTGGDDAPTAGAPTPTRDAANVISVFSDSYENVVVEDLNPNWGQTTIVSEEEIGGNNTLVYKGLNYQGLQLQGSIDVSAMTHLHLDYWTANSTGLNVFLISAGPVETPSALSVPTSGWASVDIPLIAFSPVDLANLIQFKFDGNGDIYLDNIYFYKDGGGTGGGDAPTVGASTPTRDAANVISVFSDSYENVAIEDLNPDWGQTTIVSEEEIGGSNTLVYKDLNYQGLQLQGSIDVSAMTHLHLDYWTANSTALNVFLISAGPVETPSTLSVPTSGWASVDIPLTAFSPVDLANLIQFKFDGNGDIYLDNIYFYKDGSGTGGGGIANTPIDFEPDGYGASWTWATFEAPMGEEDPTFSVVENPSIDEVNGSANVAKMDISYATDAHWGSAGCESMHGSDIGTFTITQQNKIVKMMIYQEGFAAPVALKFASPSGFAFGEIVTPNTVADAWVEVEFDMSGWIDAPETPDQIIFFPSYAPRATGHTVYFDNVTFNATGSGTGGGEGPMVGAPIPTHDAADVISVFSDSYENVPVEDLNPNWGQATIVSEEEIGGNNTLVYRGLNYQGLQLQGSINVAGMTHLHIDYWTSNSTALNAFIISPGPVETASALAVPTNGWASVDIPLTAFSPVDLADVFQFKFDGNGDIYLDNIYFYKDGNGTGGGDVPTVGAPTPTHEAADVISVFSDAYENVPVENLNPDWGQATVVTEEEIGGNNTLVYKGLNYQGLQLQGSIDVSAMTHLHLDYWTANSTALNAFLISDGPVETPSALAVPTNGWASVDIPLTAFSPVDLANLIQFKFDGNGDIYLDNLYFYKDDGGTGGGDAPMVGAPEPIHASSDVISVFSDAYENVPVEDLNPNWGQATVVSEEEIGGNNTLVYKGLNYQGLQLQGSQDVSGMTHLHIDYWTANSTALNAFIISPGPVETPYALTVPTDGWASVDIPLTDFSPVDLADVFQFKFDGNGDIYLDNIYFHRNVVSINEILAKEVGASIYPNPTLDSWTLKTDNVEMSQIQIFDMAGKQVLMLNPENSSIAEIDAHSLNTGLYFAKVTTPKGVFSMKLIKE